MLIYLIGLPGSGKTTIGKELAQLLKVPFKDLDDIIEQKEGLTVPEIFKQKGEHYFREREREALHFSAELGKGVVATGGGAPCFFDNMEFINQYGTSIFLDVSVEEIASRLMTFSSPARPLVQGKNKEELVKYLADKLAERKPFYKKAHHVVEGDAINAGVIYEKIKLQ